MKTRKIIKTALVLAAAGICVCFCRCSKIHEDMREERIPLPRAEIDTTRTNWDGIALPDGDLNGHGQPFK